MARAEKEEKEGGERGTAPFTALVIEEAEATEGGREKVAQKKQVFPQPYILTMLLFSAVLQYLRSRESSIVNFLRAKLVESPRPSISFFLLSLACFGVIVAVQKKRREEGRGQEGFSLRGARGRKKSLGQNFETLPTVVEERR